MLFITLDLVLILIVASFSNCVLYWIWQIQFSIFTNLLWKILSRDFLEYDLISFTCL